MKKKMCLSPKKISEKLLHFFNKHSSQGSLVLTMIGMLSSQLSHEDCKALAKECTNLRVRLRNTAKSRLDETKYQLFSDRLKAVFDDLRSPHGKVKKTIPIAETWIESWYDIAKKI